MRTMVYAFDRCGCMLTCVVHLDACAGRLRLDAACRCFEGALAACAAPLVGWLAEEAFGFTGKASRTGNPEEDLRRARALGSALLVFLIIPWTLCLISFSGNAQQPCMCTLCRARVVMQVCQQGLQAC